MGIRVGCCSSVDRRFEEPMTQSTVATHVKRERREVEVPQTPSILDIARNRYVVESVFRAPRRVLSPLALHSSRGVFVNYRRQHVRPALAILRSRARTRLRRRFERSKPASIDVFEPSPRVRRVAPDPRTVARAPSPSTRENPVFPSHRDQIFPDDTTRHQCTFFPTGCLCRVTKYFPRSSRSRGGYFSGPTASDDA